MNDRIDVDFSLAIHNRTGKYFIGMDLLAIPDLPVGDIYFWRIRGSRPPAGWRGKVIGRLQHWQITGQALSGLFRSFPRRRSVRPLLHLDPFTVPTTYLRRVDAVLCHDIGPVTHPHLFDDGVARIYAYIYHECERVGPHMVFVSEATRRAYLETYPRADAARTRVIYPAIRTGIAAPDKMPVAQINGPFLLTVGSIGNRKNQARCIAAFVKSGLATIGYSYVICGSRESGFEGVEQAVRQSASVVCLPYVSDAELSWLYGNATGFVLVSLLEGFGMPVAEAIACNLVPLVSRGSVLHEVAGDGALLADPESEDSIAAGMTALASLTSDERTERLKHLHVSIMRFDLETISAAWRTAFGDFLADAATEPAV